MALFNNKKIEKRVDQQFNLSSPNIIELFNKIGSTISVNRDTALSIPAFSNGVKIISQTIASLPGFIYKVANINDSRSKIPYHYLYNVIKSKPNGYMTAFEFKEFIARDLILEGNSYCLIERKTNSYRDIKALHPLTAYLVTKEFDERNNRFLFKYISNGKTTTYTEDEIWHVKNSGDGVLGKSIIEQFKDVIKQCLVIESFTTLFFEQGPNSNLILETPEGTAAPNENAITAIKLLWRKINKQSDKHTPIITPGGLTLKELKKTNLSESQLIELKTYVIQQMARIFLLPPHILSDLSKSSFNNITEQNRNILTFAINPYLHRIEQSINCFLLHDYEQHNTYCEFKRDAFVEANPVEKSEQVSNLIKAGVMTINEGRGMYNLSSVKGGDETIVFDQMTTLKFISEGTQNEK